jgi:hypothetical protein
MKQGTGGRELLVLLLLALLPLAAHAPAWWHGVLLGPGDGTALHFPLRAAVWSAYADGDIPAWNGAQFCGTPLLAAYRPGALYPPMLPLALLSSFDAFQVLVLASLSATAVLTFLYLRRLRAGLVGAYVGGLAFALGPYLVGHLDDTAAVVAAPLLPLLLLAAESHMNRASIGRASGLAAAIALLLLAGSPEGARAGAVLLFGRVATGHVFSGSARPPRLRFTLAAVGAGLLLAAPQLLPALLAATEAGRPITGLATTHDPLPGAMGLIMRYISHTPAAALALAALPLVTTHPSVRMLALAIVLSLALQWGSPLNAHGVGPVVFDFTLAVLAGISLDAQWTLRGLRRGRRLRAYFLSFTLASCAALSIAAAALGPLPQALTGPVGVLALALILFFSLAGSPSPVRAGLWLLPLTVSFLLQPHGRNAWRDSATRAAIEPGTATRTTVDRMMGLLGEERVLTLARTWPRETAVDLGYGGIAAGSGRRSANGYDPMVPLRTRQALGGMNVAGLLPDDFLRTHPGRLDALGVRWAQAPSPDLIAPAESRSLHLALAPGEVRLFPLPIVAATEIHLISSLSDSVAVEQGAEIATLTVRLASGRGDFSFPLRAGVETAEWAHDRPDVRVRVRHRRPPATAESWRPQGAAYQGHRYLAVLRLPGRYNVDAVRLALAPTAPPLLLSRVKIADRSLGQTRAVSALSAYVSDTGTFRETASMPALRLFERPHVTRTWVAERLRVLPHGDEVLAALGAMNREGIDPQREVLVEEHDAPAAPLAGRAGRAEVMRWSAGRIDLRAEGPGWLVAAEAWSRGWRARVDGAPAEIVRVNHMAMAVALSAGTHRVALRYDPPGWRPGLGLAAVPLLAVGAVLARRRWI